MLSIQNASTFEPRTFGFPFMFTGELMDANALVYLRARYYHPGLGVFTALDPVEGVNRYQYVGGNVVNKVDPTGMFAWGSFVTEPSDTCYCIGREGGIPEGQLENFAIWLQNNNPNAFVPNKDYWLYTGKTLRIPNSFAGIDNIHNTGEWKQNGCHCQYSIDTNRCDTTTNAINQLTTFDNCSNPPVIQETDLAAIQRQMEIWGEYFAQQEARQRGHGVSPYCANMCRSMGWHPNCLDMCAGFRAAMPVPNRSDPLVDVDWNKTTKSYPPDCEWGFGNLTDRDWISLGAALADLGVTAGSAILTGGIPLEMANPAAWTGCVNQIGDNFESEYTFQETLGRSLLACGALFPGVGVVIGATEDFIAIGAFVGKGCGYPL